MMLGLKVGKSVLQPHFVRKLHWNSITHMLRCRSVNNKNVEITREKIFKNAKFLILFEKPALGHGFEGI